MARLGPALGDAGVARAWAFSGLRGALRAVSRVGGSRARLAFRGLFCWEASVALYLWFRFWAWCMIVICRWFCNLRGLLAVPVGTMGSFWPGVGPFRAAGELMGCVQG